MIEDADLKAAQELFGGQDKPDINLDEFTPKTAKDFELLGRALASTYMLPHASNQHYKSLLKGLLKAAIAPQDAQFVKDVETTLAGLRTDKLKDERAKVAAAKGEASAVQPKPAWQPRQCLSWQWRPDLMLHGRAAG